MKLSIDKNIFLDALKKIQTIVGLRTPLPILMNVFLQAGDESLTLTTTDLEVSVRIKIDAKVSREGETTLPVRRLFAICREMPESQIAIVVGSDNVASIDSGSSHFKLMGLSSEDFPPLPKFESSISYELDQSVLKNMLEKTEYAASTEESRYILNGLLFSFKGDNFTVVATDGKRLALVEQELNLPTEVETEFVVPTKSVTELIKVLGDEGTVSINADENQVSFEFSNILIISKLIEGTYPNYRQVIPAESDERIVLEREMLLTALKRVSLLTESQTASVVFSFGNNQLQLEANTPEIGESRDTLPIRYDGKEIAISFNPEYFMQPLRQLASDEVFIELTDKFNPGVIKSNIPFLYVIMPIRT